MSLRPRGEEWDKPEPEPDTRGSGRVLHPNDRPEPRVTGQPSTSPFQSKHTTPQTGDNAANVLAAVARAAEVLPKLLALHRAAMSKEGTPEFEAEAQVYADYLQEIVTREPGRVLALLLSAGITGIEELNNYTNKDNK